MKRSYSISIFLVFLIFGCTSNKEKNVKEDVSASKQIKSQTVQKSKKVKKDKKQESLSDSKILEHATRYKGSIKGQAVILSFYKHSQPIDFEGSKAKAINMPDGSLWGVRTVNDKNMLIMPDGKLVEEKTVNGKMELITDDNKTYMVKMINNEMVAVAVNANSSEINLASK